MSCPFTGPKMTAFCASSTTFEPVQKTVLLNANHLFVRHKMFVTGTICKLIFGLAQRICTNTKNFLGPVKGEGEILLI